MADNNWLDTQALLGWVIVFEREDCEVVSLTEAGRAALEQAQAEDTEIDPFPDQPDQEDMLHLWRLQDEARWRQRD